LKDYLLGLAVEPLPGAIPAPELGGGGKRVQAQIHFLVWALSCAVVENKAVTVGGENKGDLQGAGVFEPLLHSIADAVAVVLGFNQGDGDVRLIIEDKVSLLSLAAADQLAPDDDPTLGEIDLLPDLLHVIPA